MVNKEPAKKVKENVDINGPDHQLHVEETAGKGLYDFWFSQSNRDHVDSMALFRHSEYSYDHMFIEVDGVPVEYSECIHYGNTPMLRNKDLTLVHTIDFRDAKLTFKSPDVY